MRNKANKKFFIFDKNTGDVAHTIFYVYEDSPGSNTANPSEEFLFNIMKNHKNYKDLNIVKEDYHIHEPSKDDDDAKNGRTYLFKFNNGSIDKITEEQFNQNKQIQTVGG